MKRQLLILLLAFILSLQVGYAATADTIQVYSSSMKKFIKNVVVKPDRLTDNMPSLFLLHGAGDSYSGWVNKVPHIKNLADQYGIIIICPDGAVTSWYFDSPIDSSMRYETYVARELTAWANSNLPLSTDRTKRAIAGLSMGGHGAFYLAMNNPAQWGLIGSMSGGVDFRSFPDSWNIKKRIGSKSEYPENWENFTVFNQTDKLKKNQYKIIFDCGTEDFFYPMNKAFHEKLLMEGIAHDYTERPGAHNWNYWGNSINYQILYFITQMK